MLAMRGRNRPLVLVETHLPGVSPPWLEELPAQSVVLQAGEEQQPADTELALCQSPGEGQAAGWEAVSTLTCEQLKMKLDTSVAVPAIRSRCESVSPSTALTQPHSEASTFISL